MSTNRILGSLATLFRTQLLGMIAVVMVLGGGAAYAAVAKDSVVSKSIKNGQVKTVDLKDGGVTTPKLAIDAVTSAQVANGTLTGADVADSSLVGNDLQDNTVTGADVNESTLGTVNNAAAIGGVGAAQLMRSAVYKLESAVAAGTALGDGTFVLGQACNAGDVLLSGGPANVAATSDMIESFPSPGTTNGWSARIDKNAQTDNFSVVILCVDQTP